MRGNAFFFFQAEDGIRDADVTGVQTCALPIFLAAGRGRAADVGNEHGLVFVAARALREVVRLRSEERRVGKECRSRGWPCCGKRHSRKETCGHDRIAITRALTQTARDECEARA